MIKHIDLGENFFSRLRILFVLLQQNKIRYGGNIQLKIYGKIDCTSGKRMQVKNRVFFIHEAEALQAGFRPCGHCMRKEYLQWKKLSKSIL